MRPVTVVGAGFSGLTLAHYLQKEGFEVTVVEKQKQCGGLISSQRTEFGLVESAANAMLADVAIEQLFDDLGVEFASRYSARKKRYIFWERPTRWPLTFKTSSRAIMQLVRFASGSENLVPRRQESVREFACRVVNEEFDERLIAPALQGIYAGDTRRLSAHLIVRSMLAKRKKGAVKGSVAPENGMGQLIEALRAKLKVNGAIIQNQVKYELPDYMAAPTVLATSAWAAAEILKPRNPVMAAVLEQCESLAVVSVTLFFEKQDTDLDGFGCLFPNSQGFHSLGVLFNSSVFDNRSPHRSETWILGGATNPEIVACSDEQILDMIRSDRILMSGDDARPLDFKINRWARAIPHYTVDWECALRQLKVEPPLYLHGNYLGALGLAGINARSLDLAKNIKESYG